MRLCGVILRMHLQQLVDKAPNEDMEVDVTPHMNETPFTVQPEFTMAQAFRYVTRKRKMTQGFSFLTRMTFLSFSPLSLSLLSLFLSQRAGAADPACGTCCREREREYVCVSDRGREGRKEEN